MYRLGSVSKEKDHMHWLTKHLPVFNGLHERKFIRHVLGVIGMCCSVSVLADPLSFREMNFDSFALICNDSAIVMDEELSTISGKGAVEENNDKLAVILWDEGRNGDRRPSNHGVDSHQNLQVVNLTVNRR
jgi:hypothetical protein